MAKKLNILIVDDSEDDARLVEREVRRSGYDAVYERADTPGAMRDALQKEWDVVISDHRMPGFDSTDALALLGESGKDIPFIIVSGHIGEETAVAAMKAGADDYLRKENLHRLVPAIEREMAESAGRRKRREAEAALAESEARYRALFELMLDAFALVAVVYDETGNPADYRFLQVNDAFERHTGKSADEVLGRRISEVLSGYDRFLIDAFGRVTATGVPERFEQTSSALGRSFDISAYSPGPGLCAVLFRDVTQRKKLEERQRISMHILEMLNSHSETRAIIIDILKYIKASTGFDAVAIRLREGEDYPYFVQNGFSSDFIESENSLCRRDGSGAVARDPEGNPDLECVRGDILMKRFNPSLSYYTEKGSFWTGNLSALLASSEAKDLAQRARERLRGEGYESLAVIPLYSGDDIIGLLQMSDRRKGVVTGGLVSFYESVGASIGIALERRRLEDEIRESEARYRDIFENSVEGICQTDSGGRFLRVNPALAHLYGYDTPEEMIANVPGILSLKYVDPEERVRLMKRVNQGERVTNHEIEFYRGNEERIWVSVNARAVFADDGKVLFYEGTITDITERKWSEITLRKNTERLRIAEQRTRFQFQFLHVVINAINEPIFFKDKEGRYTGCNTAFENYLGMPMSEIIGKTTFDVAPPDLAEIHDEKDRALIESGGTQVYEAGVRFSDGTIRDTLISKSVFYEPGGGVGGIVGVMVDISDRKRAENAIRESERFALSTVNALASNIAILDERGEIISVNSAWREFAYANADRPELMFEGTNYLEACDKARAEHFEGAEEFAAGIRAVMAGMQDSYEREYPCDSPAARRWYVGRVTRFPGTGPLRVVVAHTDITERKLAEERIAASLREKELLLREIHHRVKNNLQVISSLIGLQSSAARNSGLHDGINDVLRDMQNRIRSMAIVHDKLYHSEDFANVDFGEYVKSISSNIMQSLGIPGGKIRLVVDVKGVKLGIDEAVPCGLIINETITNALKHAFPGDRPGEMRVTMTRDGDGLFRLSVKDDGVGLPAGVDVGNADTLGLRLVRVLAAQLDGKLEVRRNAGTEFVLSFSEERAMEQ